MERDQKPKAIDDEPVSTPDADPMGVGDDVMAAVAAQHGLEWGAEAKPDAPAEPESEAKPAAEAPAPEAPAQEPGAEAPKGEGEDDKRDRVQERIDELTRKRREAEEALAREQTEKQQLKQRVSELERQQAPADVHPAFLTEDPAELERLDQQLRAHEQVLLKHWDGYNAEKEGEQSFSAEQVRERWAMLRDERDRILPAARRMIAQRAQADEAVRKVYPELLQPESAEARAIQQIVQAVPSLKKYVNYKLMLGDMLAGKRLREERSKPKAEPPPKAPAIASEPKAPASAKSPAAPRKPQEADFSAGRFLKRGGDREALVAEIAEVMGS